MTLWLTFVKLRCVKLCAFFSGTPSPLHLPTLKCSPSVSSMELRRWHSQCRRHAESWSNAYFYPWGQEVCLIDAVTVLISTTLLCKLDGMRFAKVLRICEGTCMGRTPTGIGGVFYKAPYDTSLYTERLSGLPWHPPTPIGIRTLDHGLELLLWPQEGADP